ncbi:flagellar basal-body MS-ring/collar protein FliF [Pseudoteredinibacter isoporae]|uniref:flagellar basal-body MS-ring/collar protein FliF n=1 Tax=Pseudoteredinibacter isoporae TaxID=570281 RepID=UPI003104E5FF
MSTAETDMGDFAEDGGAESQKKSSSDLVEGFNNLNLVRQVGLMVGLAASVAIGFAVVLWTQEDNYRPLFSSSNILDVPEIARLLEENEIDYKVDQKNNTILVAEQDIYQARIKLAEVNDAATDGTGFELLDQEQPLGTSQFMESARYKRSLEGELARTITAIKTVKNARVHLAIPKRSVFVRDAREPRASVFVDLYAGRSIKTEQVKAIANLVASSIPELKLENVTVVDQSGNLLSQGEDNQELIMAAKQRDFTRKVEDDLTRRINSILEPVVGPEGFKAEVSADVDFTQVEQAEEVFNPDLPAIRSEQTLNEQRGNDLVAGIPGALTNQPPGMAEAPEEANGQNPNAQGANERVRSQATRNYELDRTVSYTRHQQGNIKRLTVAVVVDDKVVANAQSGESSRVPWTQDELDRMTILVRDAVGFSSARGDSVNVLNSPFIAKDELVIEEPPVWEQAWFGNLTKQAVGLLIILILLLGLLRPLLRNLAESGRERREAEEAAQLAELAAVEMEGYDSLSDDAVTLTGGETLALPSPDETYETQLNTVKALVAEDAGRVALVIKDWVSEEE